jgi:hypothetical protein
MSSASAAAPSMSSERRGLGEPRNIGQGLRLVQCVRSVTSERT